MDARVMFSLKQAGGADRIKGQIRSPSRRLMGGTSLFLGVPSNSILSRDPNLFRKPSNTQKETAVFF